jgi:type I restriction enzyme M protein
MVGTKRRAHPTDYQPPTPAKELLAEFWKLEKDAEKMLKGLAR